ncbi:MAG TPA: hypothetical protein VIJ12_09245 [Candidatus Baltobacteraceae bacterium]
MNFARLAITAAAALALASPALAAPPQAQLPMRGSGMMGIRPAPRAMIVSMGQQNHSGQNGTAWLRDTRGGLWVKISLNNERHGASEPAHIHMGTCAHLNPAPWRPLNNVVNGNSTTVVPGVTTGQVGGGRYAINVHQSLRNIRHYVSCGNISR